MCEVCEGRGRGEVCEACMREGQWEREGQERGREREGGGEGKMCCEDQTCGLVGCGGRGQLEALEGPICTA